VVPADGEALGPMSASCGTVISRSRLRRNSISCLAEGVELFGGGVLFMIGEFLMRGIGSRGLVL